jgi:hypothetical protein
MANLKAEEMIGRRRAAGHGDQQNKGPGGEPYR